VPFPKGLSPAFIVDWESKQDSLLRRKKGVRIEEACLKKKEACLRIKKFAEFLKKFAENNYKFGEFFSVA